MFHRFYPQDAVGIKAELDFNLGNTGGHGRDIAKYEFTQFAVVCDHVTLALVNGDFQVFLPVYTGGVLAANAGRNLGIPGDDRVH